MLRLDINLLFTIINVLIIFVIIRVFLFKPVNNILAKRQEEIDKQFADAEKAENEANELKEKYAESMKSIDEERAEAINDARTKASAEYERIVEDAKQQADKIMEDARKSAAVEKEKTVKDAQQQIAELVIAAAAKVVASGQGQEADRELYNQFLAKTGEMSE